MAGLNDIEIANIVGVDEGSVASDIVCKGAPNMSDHSDLVLHRHVCPNHDGSKFVCLEEWIKYFLHLDLGIISAFCDNR